MVKVSGFIVGILLVSGIVGVLGLVLSDFATQYSVTYDESELEVYNKLGAINASSSELRDKTTGITEKPGALDVVGGFFSDAYSAFKITLESFDLFNTIANNAAEQANIGQAGSILKNMFVLIVLVLILVGVFISAIMKMKV